MPKLEIGAIVKPLNDPQGELRKVTDLGLRSCQACSWESSEWTSAAGDALVGTAGKLGVEITSFWAGTPGPRVWNFVEGPRTIGLVPAQYRQMRTEALLKAADFAGDHGIASITTHVGFIPEDPNDPDFAGVVEAIKRIADRCQKRGVEFWFETGQETPVTLLRTMQAVGAPNLGVNLDPANLIVYGKANPVDALDVLGKYVRGVHAKDGLYPTDGLNLGEQTPIGEGKVDFPALIGKLKAMGYAGALTIEREITGPRQQADIRAAVAMLSSLC
jgi:sugar phosphate isomerase/epimerase